MNTNSRTNKLINSKISDCISKKWEMIFVQFIWDNFVDNSLSYSHYVFILSLHYSFFLLFLSQKKWKQKSFLKIVKYLLVQITFLVKNIVVFLWYFFGRKEKPNESHLTLILSVSNFFSNQTREYHYFSISRLSPIMRWSENMFISGRNYHITS
jgi:hypothetical protein